ncbi:MAG: N-acyl homoserine lactonase family protein [Terricaulis sp.]
MSWRPALLAVLAGLLAGCDDHSSTRVRLYAIDCGRLEIPDISIFSDEPNLPSEARSLVDPCYLVRHPRGDLIWDTGIRDSVADMPNGQAEDDGTRLVRDAKLTTQLARLGLTPDDIEYVAFSHSHNDHVGNANLFAHATWIVDDAERVWMFRPAGREGPDFAAYNSLESARVRSLGTRHELDVFGDGAVTVIGAPGHTPGHSVLMVRLVDAGVIILSGDLWPLRESRALMAVPVFNTNRAQTLSSMVQVERLAQRTGATVIRQHVEEDFNALPAFPRALD